MRRSGYSSIPSYREEDLNSIDDTDGRLDDEEEARIIGSNQKPIKALFLVFFLFFMGFLTLTVSSLILIGHIHDSYADRMIPLMILGLLMFIPGAYYTRIVYFVVQRRPGYTYDMIPSCS